MKLHVGLGKSSLIASAALLLLAGCGQNRNDAAAVRQDEVAGVMPAAITGTQNILAAGPSQVISSSDCMGTRNPKRVRLVIKDNLLKRLGSDRTIDRDVNIEVDATPDDPQPTPPNIGASQYQPTFLDLGVPASGGAGTWTQIVVRLQSNAADPMKFMPVRVAGINNPNDSSYAVLAPPGLVGKFCGRKPFNPTNPDVLRFGVKLAVGEVVSFNIGLLIPDKQNPGYYIPIYLDPNMKNIG